jgi:hypothetical protein
MNRITFAGRTFPLPRSRWVRTTIGIVLVILGLFGFLPILGFWMMILLAGRAPEETVWQPCVAPTCAFRRPPV